MYHTGYGGDTDPRAEIEAEEAERLERQQDADQEMAEMTRAGDAAAAAERRGICTHGSSVGYRGGPRSAQQEGLKPSQVRCTKGTSGCAAVFESDEAWHTAMDKAIRRRRR
jgi:hypothetical protein